MVPLSSSRRRLLLSRLVMVTLAQGKAESVKVASFLEGFCEAILSTTGAAGRFLFADEVGFTGRVLSTGGVLFAGRVLSTGGVLSAGRVLSAGGGLSVGVPMFFRFSVGGGVVWGGGFASFLGWAGSGGGSSVWSRGFGFWVRGGGEAGGEFVWEAFSSRWVAKCGWGFREFFQLKT